MRTHTYSEIAIELGISVARVRAIECVALRKLQYQLQHPQYKELREYWRESFSKTEKNDENIYWSEE